MKIHHIPAMLLIALLCSFPAKAQHHNRYYPPTDPLVQEKLKEWGDFKFGLLMHWGPYSQWGVVESWSLCPEDEDWCKRRGPYAANYFDYKKAYENLQTTFNPTAFDPQKWATAAKDAGMKYVIFTTKHHDGFCMFDTKYTDYKITSPNCPYSSNPQPDVTRRIFDAFRAQGFWVGAYFSKPDWHCSDYWDPYFPPKDRYHNYDISKYPEKWERYKKFTYDQIQELMMNYGKMDILWLDGGWVELKKTLTPSGEVKPMDLNIDMAAVAAMARSYQPGLLVVDRAVEGPNQNYLTPEQSLPDSILAYPWETCMTMGDSWSYVPNDNYKSTLVLIRTLCTVVSRGGNYLLNIGPGPDGDWDPTAYLRLKEIGAWMKVNSEAIYGSKPAFVAAEKGLLTTRGKNGELYLIVLADNDSQGLPAEIHCKLPSSEHVNTLSLLGSDKKVSFNVVNGPLQIRVPAALQKQPPCRYAWVFRAK
jgi:alpha-L-fucosidase